MAEMSSESERLERAGDYIMGRMNEAERERAERDLERDPKFRETVIRLAERLRSNASLSRDQAELWQSVQEAIAGLPQMRDAPIVPPHRAGSAASGRDAGKTTAFGGWRGAAAIAALAAVGGAGFVGGSWMAGRDDPLALVRMSDTQGRAVGILEITGSGDLRFLPLEMGRTDDGSVLQLWTDSGGAAGPVRLGILSSTGPLRWRGPDLPPPQAGQSYTITAASPADAALGRPGGEPLFTGVAERVSRP